MARTRGGRGSSTRGGRGSSTRGGRGSSTSGGRGSSTSGGRGSSTSGAIGSIRSGVREIRTVGGHVFRRGSMLRRSARMLDLERREMLRDVEPEEVTVLETSSERTVTDDSAMDKGEAETEQGEDDEMEAETEQGKDDEMEAETEQGEQGEDDEMEAETEQGEQGEDIEMEAETEQGEDNEMGAEHVVVEERDNEVMQPEVFRIKHSQWMKVCKFASRCDHKKTVDFIENVLSERELAWFTNHTQFRHYFHMPRHDNRRVMAMWMLLLREVETKKRKEVWFVVNGVPIRYSLTEHALLSGLNCKEYPLRHENLGGNAFFKRCFRGKKKVDVKDIEKKLGRMESNGNDRLRVAILYFLATVIKMKSKVVDGYIEPFLLRIVDDLDACKKFPWGRYSFLNIIAQVNKMVNVFNVKHGANVPHTWTFPGFILPLEVLAYECIPQLGKRFRLDVVDVDQSCPRLCKRMYKTLTHKGIPLGNIYDALGTTKEIRHIVPTPEEAPLLEQLMETHPEDDEIDPFPDTWMRYIDDGIFWKDLYDKDVATREEAEVESSGDHDGDDGADDDATKKLAKKIAALKKRMEKKLKALEKRYEKKFREQKKEMKTLVRSLIAAESRRPTSGNRGKSTMEKGECSRRRLVDEDDDSDEAEEDLETEEESEEDESESEEESESNVESEKEVESEADDTTLGQFVKRCRLRKN